MNVFLPTLSQMGFLFLLIVIGFVLARLRIIPDSGAQILSKLENNVFVPALVLSTFAGKFTVESLTFAWQYVLCAVAAVLLSILFALGVSRFLSKDAFIRDVITYGLAFSNFGFMGNAVVSAIFPDVFANYLIYVLPFWTMIYLWGVPTLLMPKTEGKKTLFTELKKLVNPMFISVLIGMVIGLLQIPLPAFVNTAAASLGNCMSPIAMLLTGLTIAKIDLKKTFTNFSIYTVSIVRLIVMPLLAMGVLYLLPIPYELGLCTVCALAMPLGLTSIVVPAAYGKDSSVAAGMALISHLLSCITIPIIFLIFQSLFT